MVLSWANFADQVRDIGFRVYGQPLQPKAFAQGEVDGYLEIAPDYSIAVLGASDASRSTLTPLVERMLKIRAEELKKGRYLKAIVVVRGDLNHSIERLFGGSAVAVVSVSSFAAMIIEYEKYISARLAAPFGSAVNPQTGEADKINYVPVSYRSRDFDRRYTPAEISEQLLNGRHVVLLGEYGSGKSRCISEVYSALSRRWGETLKFPFAINLRECCGMQTADELVRRHISKLDADDLQSSAVKVLHRQSGVYLLDGFDEMGSQAWSSDEAKLRTLRSIALKGVRDIVSRSGQGCLIAGREHYFSSFDEMKNALGLNDKNPLVLHVDNEFTAEQMEDYFEAANVSVSLPSWLPRRPLICQTIAQLESDDIDRMFSEESREAEFWEHFIEIVCKRDARINESFDDKIIIAVYMELARQSRTKPMDVGPFNLRDLQVAFEAAVGQPPTEDASVMLQRLPSLGRIGAESTDRQFVDKYILEGLRGRDVARIINVTEAQRTSALEEQWINPLGVLGQRVLARYIDRRPAAYMSLTARSARAQNATLTADLVASFFHAEGEAMNFEHIEVKGAIFGNLNFDIRAARNITIVGSVIEQLILPSEQPRNVSISGCSAGVVAGVSSFEGLPGWAKLDSVDEFESTQTVAKIRQAGLSPSQEILVAIFKKTFFQKGTGRKEDALLRGFGSGTSVKTAGKILNLLVREQILTTFKGDEGPVYLPVRTMAHRMNTMLQELRSSRDPIWLTVGLM